jgi:uncharacterized protein YjiK
MDRGYPRRAVAVCLLPALLLVSSAGCTPGHLQGADLTDQAVLARYCWRQPAAHWPLPGALEEISGLTHLGAGLLTHHDNGSTLWTLAGSAGGPPTAALLPGQPVTPLDGDFEGVTILGDMVYLLGSQGTLQRARLDPRAGSLAGAFEAADTGVEGRCNFEGIAAEPVSGFLYLACKYPREPQVDTILLFRLAPGGGVPPQALVVDVAPVLADTGLRRLRPSGLAWLPEAARLLVLAGKERVILELNGDGGLLAWRRLPRRYHRQAEGLSVSPGGDVVIADEADGRTATLSRYRSASAPAVQRCRERL